MISKTLFLVSDRLPIPKKTFDLISSSFFDSFRGMSNIFIFWLTMLILWIPKPGLSGKCPGQCQANSNPAQQTVGNLTTSAGAPVGFSDVNSLEWPSLINNDFFMDSITHFVRERIPERSVHARGAGAFGYFEVTQDITSKCKAKLFENIGKKTPIAVRFSETIMSSGASDTNREPRGFAVKFYTEEGNFDVVGLNLPIFYINNGAKFPSLIHSLRPNPVTNLMDFTSLWDFVVSVQTALFVIFIIMTDRGTPDGYRHMPGYSIHTYQVVNNRNESYFMRFHFTPEAGEKNLNASEAVRLSGIDSGYATRDLYNAIALKNYPSWIVGAQILSVDDVKKSKINPFDITKLLDNTIYPLQRIGRIILNKNPTNYFADIEQLAYCPCNVVPGILGAPDKVFEARRLAYRDAHNYRLGGNNDKIPVNCPYRTKTWTYNRDGVSPVNDNEKDAPNYYPNSFNGPRPTATADDHPKLLYLRNDFTPNLDQAAYFYYSLSGSEKNVLLQNISTSLCLVPKLLFKKVIELLCKVSTEFSKNVEKNVKVVCN